MRVLPNLAAPAVVFALLVLPLTLACSPRSASGGKVITGVLEPREARGPQRPTPAPTPAPVSASTLTAAVKGALGIAVTGSEIKCVNGKVKIFDCRNVDLLSFLPAAAIGGTRPLMFGQRVPYFLNSLWGWIDSTTDREFALVARVDGLAFVDVTDPVTPKYLGELPLHSGAKPSFWRDVKVYRNHAFIVADAAGPHGMQIFDLTQLRTVTNPPVVFQETAHYASFANAHTLALNEATGFAYAVGVNGGGETCGEALHMIDVRTPTKPTFAGCYLEPKAGPAVHENVCVVYHGPDQQYQGREICLNASGNAISFADVTDKKQPKTISIGKYPKIRYAHQGWLTDDHRYFFVNDEHDEIEALLSGTDGTKILPRTIVFDLQDLDDPVVLTEFYGTTAATDHNLYIRGRYMYQSHYKAGLRVIDVGDPKHPKEVGYFDTLPEGENMPGYAGSWTNYPYFKSAKDGIVAVSSIGEGLFMVQFRPETSP